MNESGAVTDLEFLLFELGGRRFGVPAADVREIVRAVLPVPLAGVPAMFEGVINLRGQVVPVLDPRRRLGMPPRQLEHTDHLVIVRSDERILALRVDRALQLVRVSAEAVTDFNDAVGATGRVARLPDDLVPIKDLQDLLSPAEGLSLEGALAAGGGTRP